MTRTQQSKRHSQSDTEFIFWFQKNNYMSKFLNSKSREIIERLKNKKQY
jgi:hypothetical protein